MPLDAVDRGAQLMGDIRRKLISRPIILALFLFQLADAHVHIFLCRNILRKEQIGVHPILRKNTDLNGKAGVVAPVHCHLLNALHALFDKNNKSIRRIRKILPENLGHAAPCQLLPVILQPGRCRLIAVKDAALLIEEQHKFHRFICNPGIQPFKFHANLLAENATFRHSPMRNLVLLGVPSYDGTSLEALFAFFTLGYFH